MLNLHDCIRSEEEDAKYQNHQQHYDVLDDYGKELARADCLLSDVQVVLKLAGVTGDALVDDDPCGEAVCMDLEWFPTVCQAVARTDPLVGDLDVLEDRRLLLEFDLHPLQQWGQCSRAHVVHLLFIAVEEEWLLATAKFADQIVFIL